MATHTTSTLTALTKEVWHKDHEIWDWMQRDTILADAIMKTHKVPPLGKKEGKYIKFASHIGGSANPYRSVQESRGYPTPGKSSFTNLTFNAKKFVQSMELTGEAQEFVEGGAGSVEDILAYEMDPERGQVRDWKKQRNRMLHGDGSGLIAIGASAATNVITLASATVARDLNAIKVGSEIVIRDLDDGTLATGQTAKRALVVTAISTAVAGAFTITVLNEDGTTPTLTVAATDGVYFYDAQGKYMAGLGIHCSAANPTNWGSTALFYGGLDRSSADGELWQGFAHDAGGDGINLEEDLDVVLDALEERVDGGAGDLALLCVLRQQPYNSIKNQLKRDQRTDGGVKMLQWGHKGIKYENLAFVKDTDAKAAELRILNPKDLFIYQPRKPFWDERGGDIWNQQNESGSSRPADIWRANMLAYEELCAGSCRCAVRIHNTGFTR